jgi:hypothetical protein
MPIQAIALLKLTDLSTSAASGARIEPLDDCALLHTGESFATEPEQLSARVRALLGEAVADRHDDARGIFYIPDVAAPKARTYDAVIAEVGEGGAWGPLRTATAALPAALAGLDLGAMMAQIPPSLLDAVSEMTRRDPNALENASKQLHAMIGQSGTQGVGALLNSAGIDLSSGGLQQLVDSMQNELEANPGRLAELAEQLLGGGDAAKSDDPDDR